MGWPVVTLLVHKFLFQHILQPIQVYPLFYNGYHTFDTVVSLVLTRN